MSEAALDFDTFEREIMAQANALTPELLPRLLIQLLKRDSLVFCERHMTLLFPYIRSQITLTWAKRNYYRYGEWVPDGRRAQQLSADVGIISAPMGPEMTYRLALERRDAARRQYRSTPCVCFKQHR